MSIKFNLAKCKTKAAYSAKPLQKGHLNLNQIKRKYEVIVDTPIVLAIKIEGIEIIVHHHGEIMFKNCDNLQFMEETARKIYQLSLQPRNSSFSN